jgi:hypothetical protein
VVVVSVRDGDATLAALVDGDTVSFSDVELSPEQLRGHEALAEQELKLKDEKGSLEAWSRPIWVVHGGGDWDGPENTLAALAKSAALGATYAEIDLRVTKEGQVVLIHDETIDRTTNGSGRVDELTYEQIGGYDAGSWYGSEFTGERIPLLSAALSFARDHEVRLLLHVKDPAVCPRLWGLLRDHQMANDARVYMKAADEAVRRALDPRVGQYPGSLVQPWGYKRGPQIVLDALCDSRKGGALVGSYTCVLEAFPDEDREPQP